MSVIVLVRSPGVILDRSSNTCLSAALSDLYSALFARWSAGTLNSRSYFAFWSSLKLTLGMSYFCPNFCQSQPESQVLGVPHLNGLDAIDSSPWKNIGVPGPVRPMPAAKRAALRDHCGGSSCLLPLGWAASMVRWAFPTSSWLEMICSASRQPVSPRGLVIMSMKPSMLVCQPLAAAWMMPGLSLSWTSRCWYSVYHWALKPAPPLASRDAGLVIAGS